MDETNQSASVDPSDLKLRRDLLANLVLSIDAVIQSNTNHGIAFSETIALLEVQTARLFNQGFGTPSFESHTMFQFEDDLHLRPTILCSLADISRFFGLRSAARKRLMSRLIDITECVKRCNGHRLIVGGSFASNLENPKDLDCCVLVDAKRLAQNDLEITYLKSLSLTFNESLAASNDQPDIDLRIEQSLNGFWGWFDIYNTPRDGIERRGVLEVILE